MNLTIGFLIKLLKLLQIPIALSVWLIWLILPPAIPVFEKQAEIRISTALNPGLQHFLDLVDPDKNSSFDPQLINPVMDFVESPKDAAALYFANKIGDLTSAYYDFDINRNLFTIVQYAFNPKIPSIATMPSSARLFHWMDGRLKQQPLPDVARYLDRLDNPVVIEGLQAVQITPDLNSGAYYSYNVYQTLLMFKHRQRKVLVTVSKQTDVSTVGKKVIFWAMTTVGITIIPVKPGLPSRLWVGCGPICTTPVPLIFIMKSIRARLWFDAPCLGGSKPAGPVSTWSGRNIFTGG